MSGRCVVFTIEALTIGGAEQMLVAMANRFAERGWKVHVICLSTAGELATRLSAGIQLDVLDKTRGLDWRLPAKLRRLMRQIDPDVVNSHLWTANTWTRFSLAGTGYPVLVTEHSRDFWKSGKFRLIDRLLSLKTQKLIAVSNDTADYYRSDVGIRNELVTVINNGIDARRFATGQGRELRESLVSPGQILIGTIGRMVSAKNHPRLVEAMARLCQTHRNVHLVFVGDGPERKVLEDAIETAGIKDRITLLGSRSDTPDLLDAFDIFVLSSDREGHPLTALEAQAAGVPVVLTDAGGSADAIASDGEQSAGFLVEKSADALVAALNRLIVDSTLRARMGQFGQQYALMHFDLETMVSRYEQLFLEAAGELSPSSLTDMKRSAG